MEVRFCQPYEGFLAWALGFFGLLPSSLTCSFMCSPFDLLTIKTFFDFPLPG